MVENNGRKTKNYATTVYKLMRPQKEKKTVKILKESPKFFFKEKYKQTQNFTTINIQNIQFWRLENKVW